MSSQEVPVVYKSSEQLRLQLGTDWAVEQIQLPLGGGDGGDFVLTRHFGDTLQIFVGDAAGHGPEAAGLANTVRRIIERDGEQAVTAERLAAWNREVEPTLGGKFVCLTCIEIDSAARLVRVANCGNPELLIVRNGGEIEQCPATGMPLGMIEPELWHSPTVVEFALSPDDAIVCVTDGVTEQAGPEKQRFGIERVLTAVASATIGRAVSFLDECLTTFAGEMPREDDVTMLCIGQMAKRVA